jgi:uncharacterized membrane protein SirB2
MKIIGLPVSTFFQLSLLLSGVAMWFVPAFSLGTFVAYWLMTIILMLLAFVENG